MRKIFDVYFARAETPYCEAYADLALPATPYEQQDAMDKLRKGDAANELY